MREAPPREQWPDGFPGIPGRVGPPTFAFANADMSCDASSVKKLLGGRVVPMTSIFTVGCHSFEVAGLLGAKYGAESDDFLKCLWPVGSDRRLLDKLADYTYAKTQDLGTIDLFVLSHEASLRGLVDGSLDDVIAKASKESLSIPDAMGRFTGIYCCGAALGMVWPDRMRAIYQRSYYPEDWHPQPSHEIHDPEPYEE